jgi:hypothetical protein
MFIDRDRLKSGTPLGVRYSAINWLETNIPRARVQIQKRDSREEHGTPKGVRLIGTGAIYKHPTPLELKHSRGSEL